MANPGKGEIERLLCVYKKENNEENLRALAIVVSSKVKADLYRFKLTKQQSEEAYSECMEKLFIRGALDAFDAGKAIAGTYMGAIVRNTVFSLFEKAGRENKKIISLSAPLTEEAEFAPQDCLKSPEVPPDSAVLADELLKQIKAAVLSIRNGRHREIYLLYLMSGASLKYEVLGAVFEEKQTSARTVINRCKHHVAARLEQELGDVFCALSAADLEAVKAKAAKVETWAGTSVLEGIEELEALGSAGSLSGASAICGRSAGQICAAVRKFTAKASANLKATVNEVTASFYTVKETIPEKYGLESSIMKTIKSGITGFVDSIGKRAPSAGVGRGTGVKEEHGNFAGREETALISLVFEEKVISGIVRMVKR